MNAVPTLLSIDWQLDVYEFPAYIVAYWLTVPHHLLLMNAVLTMLPIDWQLDVYECPTHDAANWVIGLWVWMPCPHFEGILEMIDWLYSVLRRIGKISAI